MIIGIYQSLIIHIMFVFHNVESLSITIEGNVSGILGENGTEIQCSYTKENVRSITSVNIMAFNRSSVIFEQITAFLPDDISTLLPQGNYLKGRVTLMSITQSSTKAVMIFNKLNCIDDTFYKCSITYTDSSFIVQTDKSSNISIQVQVTPSKPDRILLMTVSADSSSTNPTVPMYPITSSSSPAVTRKVNETFSTFDSGEQNDITLSDHSALQTTDPNTISSTPSDEDLFNDNSYRTTTNYIQQTTTAQGIAEGDNINIVCTGDVGNPPAEHVFQKYLNGKIVPMKDTVITTSITIMPVNCSYYRTSSITFQVTAEDNLAVIRCVVDSSMANPDMYVETEPIEVYYEVSTPTITKYPNKTHYVVGEDTSIQLTCKSDGNPQPDYYWYKENSDNPKSASENLTIKVMNKTDSGVYVCDVNNTFNGGTYTRSTKMQVHVITKAETSTIPSSSPGSSSGTDEKYGNEPEDLTWVYVGVSVAVIIVLLAVLGCYLFIRKRKGKGKDESAENNGSTNNLMHCNSKYVGGSRPDAYDSVVLEGDVPVKSSGKKEQNVEDVRKHNEEYMKNQTKEKNENKLPTSQQPVIYAEVNKATKSKNRQETSNQQDDDTYAGTQEGIYDQSGNRRHKENENAEQFDKIGDIKKKPGTDDAESSVKSNQKGSYVNQALNKGEKQVATVPPISRSSSGSQGYEQTSELSQKGYENVKGTDNTHTSDGHTINQTSF